MTVSNVPARRISTLQSDYKFIVTGAQSFTLFYIIPIFTQQGELMNMVTSPLN